MTYGRDVRSDNWEVEGIGVGEFATAAAHFDVWGEEGRQQRSTCGALHGECGEARPWLHLSMGTCLTV